MEFREEIEKEYELKEVRTRTVFFAIWKRYLLGKLVKCVSAGTPEPRVF